MKLLVSLAFGILLMRKHGIIEQLAAAIVFFLLIQVLI